MAGPNESGQAYALTVMAPIIEGHAGRLAKCLDGFGTGDESPLHDIGSTHFARFVVMDGTVFEGGHQKPDPWSGPRLLFTSNFDGELDPYLELLRTRLGAEADNVWSHCEGYPGSKDGIAFAAWIKRHQVDTSLFYAAYGEKTVDEVKEDLLLRGQLNSFVLENQGAPSGELKRKFLAAFK